MKTTPFLTAALALLAALSCNREQHPAEGKPVEVTVSIQGSGTRATDVTYADESKVGSLQVFVFNGGKLEDYQDAGEALTTQVAATSGERTVWAVVNAPSLSGITSETELKSGISHLSENKKTAFVMCGSTTQELTDGGSVSVVVRRLVSRVSVEKITTDYKYSLAQENLTVHGIYLINVAGDITYDATGTPDSWVNQLGHKDAAYDALLYDAVDATVNNQTPYTKEHVFYPYPNPTEKASYEDEWTPRHTMLVVEVTFEGKKGYYPVELPILERNKTYFINELKLTHRPGDKPYKPIETGEAVVQITVSDWEVGLNLGTQIL